jgi:hypothetical protein
LDRIGQDGLLDFRDLFDGESVDIVLGDSHLFRVLMLELVLNFGDGLLLFCIL